jgi:amidohydrolase
MNRSQGTIPPPAHADAWTAALDAIVESLHDRLVALRRHLHSHPEPSGREHATTAYLRDRLADAAVDTRTGPDGRGLIVEPRNARDDAAASPDAPRIMIRGDIDALHIQDGKSTPYASTIPGVMHACGHDGHATIALGVALALAEAQRRGVLPWPTPWRVVLQPAEETNAGALEMIDAGCLDAVGAALSLHMDPSRQVGRVAIRRGVMTADCDELAIRILGRGGHASRPHESIDPIAAAAQLISSIYLFVPRGVESHNPVVVTIGKVRGGENYNVIPDRVDLLGTIRSIGAAARQRTISHIRQLARGIAEASGTKIDADVRPGPPSVRNNGEMTEMVRRCAIELLGNDAVDTIDQPSMGGEDFAHYLEKVPGCMFRLGCSPTSEPSPPLHSPMFDLDERSLVIGAKVLARAAVRWAEPGRRAEDYSI